MVTLRHASHQLLKRRRDGQNLSRHIGPEELVVLVQYSQLTSHCHYHNRQHGRQRQQQDTRH